MVSYVGRYAPSPTGPLHLGNLLAAVIAWVRARQAGGQLLLRMEDLDQGRCRPEAAASIQRTLAALGFRFDGDVVTQSEDLAVYADAVEQLRQAGHLFACRCSRKDVANAASAPHAGDDGPVYPGTCRALGLPFVAGQTSWRFLVPPGEVAFVDAFAGEVRQEVATRVGDFVIQRKDSVFAYHLAVVVDDARQGVTEVVRGRDLLSSTPRQLLLYRALGQPPPTFAHLPLWVDGGGHRLAKRGGSLAIDALLDTEGPGQVLGRVGRALGVARAGERLDLPALCSRLTPAHMAVQRVCDHGPLG